MSRAVAKDPKAQKAQKALKDRKVQGGRVAAKVDDTV